MVSVREGRTARWVTVLAGTAALAVTPALLGAAGGPNAGPPADEVVADALRSAVVAYSGLVQVDGWLGLPTLALQNDATAQLDTSTRVRTWWVSPTVWRTDTLTPIGPREDVAAPGATRAANGERSPALIRATLPGLQLPRTADLMPPAAARTLLAWLSPSDRLRPLPPGEIAGHDASGARVVSGEPSSSVAALDVWVDSLTGLPLELDLYTRGNAEPVFRTRFLEVSTQRPDPAVVSPLPSGQGRWSGLPGTAGTGLPAGIATYGSGFARLALLELPPRLVPRVEAAVGAQTVDVGTGRAAVLRSRLLQVAVIQTADGRGYLLAGTVTGDAMDAAVRATLADLPGGAAG